MDESFLSEIEGQGKGRHCLPVNNEEEVVICLIGKLLKMSLRI